MPILMKVRVVSLKEQKIPPFTGEYIRGFFLNIIRKNLPHVNLHDGEGPRPYAIKPLYPDGKKRIIKGKWAIREGESLTFEIGIFDPRIEEELFRVFVTNIPEQIVIENGVFGLGGIDVVVLSYKELLCEDGPTFLGIEFKTPSIFSGDQGGYLFPDPVRLFGSIVNIWNTFSDAQKIDKKELLDWITKNVRVKHYKLYTREVSLKDFSVVGFKGRIAFLIRPHEEYIKIIRSLIRLSLISNIGKKRTFGFGVISASDLLRNKKEELIEKD